LLIARLESGRFVKSAPVKLTVGGDWRFVFLGGVGIITALSKHLARNCELSEEQGQPKSSTHGESRWKKGIIRIQAYPNALCAPEYSKQQPEATKYCDFVRFCTLPGD
jgi:hypothetical protein